MSLGNGSARPLLLETRQGRDYLPSYTCTTVCSMLGIFSSLHNEGALCVPLPEKVAQPPACDVASQSRPDASDSDLSLAATCGIGTRYA